MPKFSIEYSAERELTQIEQDRVVSKIKSTIKQEKRIKFLKQFALLSMQEQEEVMQEINKRR
jgi:hypothetical protein